MRNTDATEVIARMSAVVGATNDSELARELGVRRSTVGSWRARASVPYAECVRLAADRGVSLDWLLLGKESYAPRVHDEHQVRDGDALDDSCAELRLWWGAATTEERAWLVVTLRRLVDTPRE